jgi:RHS repeat-associated protein
MNWEEYVKFTYDGNGQRVKKENVDAAQTTLYFGELYEKRGTVEILHVFAGSTRVASIRSDSMNQFYHPNHLGSASVVTSSSGDWGERIEYYPFGSYRLDEKNPNLPGFPDANYTFTGQEDDDDLGLYNFGARLYDPVIARFISPDSLVQAPEDPQTLNRYSYARNNPLIYSDPSGNFFLVDDLAALIGSMLVAKLIVSAAAGAALGAGIAAATGGDIGKGALTGAISGVIFLGAGEIIPGIQTALGATKGVAEVAVKTGVHMAAGAVSGAINSAITGTDIGLGVVSGAIGAGIAAGVGGGLTALKLDKFGYQFVGRVVSGAIAGGIAAELYGGNFWEGFKLGGATAAAAFLFNEMMGPHGKKGNAGGCAGGDGEDLVEDFYEYEMRKMEEKIEMDRIAMELALIKAGEGIQTGMRLGLKAFFIWGVGRGAIEAYSGASSNVGPLIRFLWRISVVPTQVRSDTPQGEK